MTAIRILATSCILVAGSFSLALAQETAGPLVSAVEAWLASPHARRGSESFTHWNEDGEIPAQCATCHSSIGIRDFLGGDGSAAGLVDQPVALGALIDCTACHSAAASVLDQVTFPSGVSIGDLGSSAVCMVCHQGRQSSDGVEAALVGLDDAVSPELGFVNIHYRAAAASLMGTEARGGFEYPGKTYAGRFAHVPDFNTCTTCHDPHGLQVRPEPCAECHKTADLTAIRTRPADVDGDGDTGEGVAGEIASLHDALGRAISAYAAQIADASLVYAPDAYPYFFGDLNGNGALDAEEAAYPNRYQSWTPRLLRAAYNYQFIAKDPGIYAHNPTYAIQLLIDSIDDLGESTGVVAGNSIRP
ncbi:polyheme membrane-associated cytochrome C [Defluviimonas aestuarii]|uniref:cytochrome c3 family protein n=1 Tax=Albidovulum aestuarii TaxID=1130726 RepID=UPI00249CD55A|nr:polyheme membrane-associated cytochrome C [Defluviimonas aestuarii]MDI3338072.1 polyheme membrane-associated cytochrome C [Defluviimonas aestuarii]